MNKKFFNRLPDMECLSGDTLEIFRISPTSGSFDGCRMQLIVARQDTPKNAIICRECTLVNGSFEVRLTSEFTEKLAEGMHIIHFRLIDSDGLSYRKLMGNLYVHSAAKGAENES